MRRSREQWTEIVEQFERSGESPVVAVGSPCPA
jgi:hypothetical protein